MEAWLAAAATAVIVGLAGFWVQRAIANGDKKYDQDQTAIFKKFEDHERRMNQHGDRLREAEIELEKKITREELKELRLELKQDFNGFQAAVLAAIATASKGGQ